MFLFAYLMGRYLQTFAYTPKTTFVFLSFCGYHILWALVPGPIPTCWCNMLLSNEFQVYNQPEIPSYIPSTQLLDLNYL